MQIRDPVPRPSHTHLENGEQVASRTYRQNDMMTHLRRASSNWYRWELAIPLHPAKSKQMCVNVCVCVRMLAKKMCEKKAPDHKCFWYSLTKRAIADSHFQMLVPTISARTFACATNARLCKSLAICHSEIASQPIVSFQIQLCHFA